MNAILLTLLALLFNAFPIPQTKTGALEAVRHCAFTLYRSAKSSGTTLARGAGS